MQATVLHWAGAAAGVLLSMVRSKLQSINDVRLASPCCGSSCSYVRCTAYSSILCGREQDITLPTATQHGLLCVEQLPWPFPAPCTR